MILTGIHGTDRIWSRGKFLKIIPKQSFKPSTQHQTHKRFFTCRTTLNIIHNLFWSTKISVEKFALQQPESPALWHVLFVWPTTMKWSTMESFTRLNKFHRRYHRIYLFLLYTTKLSVCGQFYVWAFPQAALNK